MKYVKWTCCAGSFGICQPFGVSFLETNIVLTLTMCSLYCTQRSECWFVCISLDVCGWPGGFFLVDTTFKLWFHLNLNALTTAPYKSLLWSLITITSWAKGVLLVTHQVRRCYFTVMQIIVQQLKLQFSDQLGTGKIYCSETRRKKVPDFACDIWRNTRYHQVSKDDNLLLF